MFPAPPLQQRNPIVSDFIHRNFQYHLLEEYHSNGMLVFVMNKMCNFELIQLLRDDSETSYDMMLDLCGADYPSRKERFEVIVHLHSMKYQHRIRLRFPIDGEPPEIRSITDLYCAANWAEREAYDLFGIRFIGHPNLKRILNPDDFEGHPLRKDFPVKGLKRGHFPLGHVINNKRNDAPKFYTESNEE
ncbi:MAG: NADH-quinone oxidoreductase subunit C [bacterium]|nr:NADH-quinone oxidoreductase subunit C [bacterium]